MIRVRVWYSGMRNRNVVSGIEFGNGIGTEVFGEGILEIGNKTRELNSGIEFVYGIRDWDSETEFVMLEFGN